MVYKTQEKEFVKIKDGVKAPKGFHYMPNGKLMNDAHHIAVHGYLEKKITSVEMDINDINYAGEDRKIIINGDKGAFFSIEVYDSSNNYYDFYKQTWSTKKSILKNQKLLASYSDVIKFPAETSGLKNYTVNVIAETVFNVKTSFTERVEFRNEDNSININKSTGSNSNILRRVLYQDVSKSFYVSCIAPSRYATKTDTLDGATSSSNRAVFDNNAALNINIGDLVTGTGAASGVQLIVKSVDPDGDNPKEIQLDKTDSLSDGATYTFTPPFNSVTPHYTNSTSGRGVITISTGATAVFPFSITVTAPTGRGISILRNPTIDDLCAVVRLTIDSSATAITGEDTSSSTYHRWGVNNIAGLTNGMILDPSPGDGGTNTTTPAKISNYITTNEATKIVEEDYYTRVLTTKLKDVFVPGVEATADPTTVDRNGFITAQLGRITFDVQQADALKSDSAVRIFGYGTEKIKSLTYGVGVELKDVKLELTQVSAQLTSACSASTTVAVDNVDGITWGSIVRGPGIDPSAENPIVISKSVNTGAGNITLSAAQTIEDDQVLYFDKFSNVCTITGSLEITDMSIADTTIYFDIERFLNIV